MLVHAAGESAAHRHVPPDTHAVVLAVADEAALARVEARLTAGGLAFRAIREVDHPAYGCQLMAIGIPPLPRDRVRRLVSDLPLLKGLQCG